MSEKLARFILRYFPEKMPDLSADPVEVAMKIMAEFKGVVYPPVEEPKKKFRFSATVMYNHGLGPQFKNLEGEIFADDPVEAKSLARTKADEVMGPDKWQDVRIKPLGPS